MAPRFGFVCAGPSGQLFEGGIDAGIFVDDLSQRGHEARDVLVVPDIAADGHALASCIHGALDMLEHHAAVRVGRAAQRQHRHVAVLDDLLKVCHGRHIGGFDEIDAEESAIGFLPKPEDIDLDGSGVDIDTLTALLSVDRDLWLQEADGIREFYARFDGRYPRVFDAELDKLTEMLG